MLVEFDKNDDENNQFPLNPNIQNEGERQKEIFEVLKYVYNHRKPPEQGTTQKMSINLYIPKNVEQDIIENVYKKQLLCLGKKGLGEPDLMYFFAVGFANNLPFLTWMVDAFTLDKNKDYIENVETNKKRNALTLDDWMQRNKFMKELTAKDSKKANALKTAMISYSNRMLSTLQCMNLCQYMFLYNIIQTKRYSANQS